jgi:glycosyltransferase involved in cell wall biosynthesis
MRVLMLHNRYRAAGGEERAVAEIAALLRSRGDTVFVVERSSDGAGRLRAARGMLHGGLDDGDVARAVRELRAEVVHAHNLHPLFGWRALAAAHAAGARTVLHLHNYRLFCAIGVGYRDGATCALCTGRNTLPGVVHRCRGSLAESVVYAAGLSSQQRRLVGAADALVAVSAALRERLVAMGLPRSNSATLLNFAAAVASRSAAGGGGYALVAGRLVPEKGFDTAVDAARATGVPLVVAGEGPDGARLRDLASGADVRFVGRVSEEELARLRAAAAVVLVPSRWEEPCPYAALDALATGVPVLAADRGGLPELLGRESIVADGSWARRLQELWADPALRERFGDAGLARARELLGADAYYEALTAIYRGSAKSAQTTSAA